MHYTVYSRSSMQACSFSAARRRSGRPRRSGDNAGRATTAATRAAGLRCVCDISLSLSMYIYI